MNRHVTIPKSQLRAQLDEAEAIKREMMAMLCELEAKTIGQPPAQPGSWRHHPADWAKRLTKTDRGRPDSPAAPRRSPGSAA